MILDVLVDNWTEGAVATLVGGLCILVFQGIDFGQDVAYAKRKPESRVARLWARNSARSFWLTLFLVAITPAVWPIYFIVGICFIIFALISLIKNLFVWAFVWVWEELEE